MKKISTLILTLSSLLTFAQNSANITLTMGKLEPVIVTLILEDVRYHPNLGIGLADVRMSPLAIVNFKEMTSEKTTVDLSEAKMMRLRFSGNGVNNTWMLFIQPGDDLTVALTGTGDITFTGKNAPYQEFLKAYFRENQYQYLPVFGYKPAQIDNQAVMKQSDSLKALRLTSYESFKTTNKIIPAFDAYVRATTESEPPLIQRLVLEKIMRANRVAKLDAEQRKQLEDYILNDFKVLADDALLSQSYRDELRNWALIPSTRKFPVDAKTRYEISPEALKDVYQATREKLKDFPKQKEYLLTYWFNYAVSAMPTIETSKILLHDYQALYPKSETTAYLSKMIETKSNLEPGAMLPDLTLLDRDSSTLSISQLVGKPLCMIFAFSIGQHEPNMKTMEGKYGDNVNFIYVSVASGIPMGTWEKYAVDRPGVKHLWASDENIDLLKEKYAIDIRYPFLVADAAGKIVNHWIPQEFPNNGALETEIVKAMGK
jgi:hypothetical protein